MGRKGVSKRKPKKSGTLPGSNIKGRSDQGSSVQALVNDKGAPPNRDSTNPLAGPNKSQKKR